MNLKGLIGDRAFYKKVLAISVPIIVQNTITNLVSLLDNLMVGALGTEAMSGVSIVNQFIFIFNLAIFGAIAGAGIFGAQFSGRGDFVGVRYTMRSRLLTCLLVGIGGISVLLIFGDQLISMYLHEGVEGDLALTFDYAKSYLSYVVIGLLPFAISQGYASTLRENGETFVPMLSSVISVVTNCGLNVVLIFGLFGFPALGVAGAAIATSVSRFAECIFLVVWTHRNKEKCPFAVGLYRSLYIPRALVFKIAVKGAPMLCNEFLWALSGAIRNQCYSTRGLDVFAALNISTTLFNLMSVSYLAFSMAVSIIVGNLLGAEKFDEARDNAKKLLAFSAFSGVVMMILTFCMAPIFPLFFKTSDHIRSIATYMLIFLGASMPGAALATATYYTIRSGGRVFITMLFDSVYAWCIVMPVALSLAYLTGLSVYWLMPLIIIAENLKLIPGLILVKRGIWVRKLDV